MPQCPNCGRKTHRGTYCLWCYYPLTKHRFSVRDRKRTQATGTVKQPRMPAQQVINDLQHEVQIEAEKESARIISRSKRIAELFIQDIKEEVEKESQRILHKATEKIDQETKAKAEAPDNLIEDAADPGYQPDQSRQIDTLLTNNNQQDTANDDNITHRIRVFVIDQDVFFCQGLQLCLSSDIDIEVTGMAKDYVEDTVVTLNQLKPDIVLVDIDLPSAGGFNVVQKIRGRFPAIPVVIITPYPDNEQIIPAIKSGATGYLDKGTGTEGFVDAIRRVSAGEYIINDMLTIPAVARKVHRHFKDTIGAGKDDASTPDGQEIAVIGYLADGYSSTQVADILTMSNQVIGDTLDSIRRKLLMSPSQLSTEKE